MLFTFSRACGPPFDDPKGRWRRGGGTDQCPNYPKVFNKASRSIECKGTREADWHSCDPFKMTRDDNRLVTITSTDSLNLHTEELREVPENLISSLFFLQEQCFVIFKRCTLKSAGQDNSWHSRTKCTRTSDHLLWFWPKEKENFIVAFTISPFYHGSKMLSIVQYTDARSPLTLLFTVNCPTWIWENHVYR